MLLVPAIGSFFFDTICLGAMYASIIIALLYFGISILATLLHCSFQHERFEKIKKIEKFISLSEEKKLQIEKLLEKFFGNQLQNVETEIVKEYFSSQKEKLVSFSSDFPNLQMFKMYRNHFDQQKFLIEEIYKNKKEIEDLKEIIKSANRNSFLYYSPKLID